MIDKFYFALIVFFSQTDKNEKAISILPVMLNPMPGKPLSPGKPGYLFLF